MAPLWRRRRFGLPIPSVDDGLRASCGCLSRTTRHRMPENCKNCERDKHPRCCSTIPPSTCRGRSNVLTDSVAVAAHRADGIFQRLAFLDAGGGLVHMDTAPSQPLKPGFEREERSDRGGESKPREFPVMTWKAA